MSSEQKTHPLSPKLSSNRPFAQPYRFGGSLAGENSYQNHEGVNFSSTLGKMCESVALKILSDPYCKMNVGETDVNIFQPVIGFFQERFGTTKISDGKTKITHESIVPHYKAAIQDNGIRERLILMTLYIKGDFPEIDLLTPFLKRAGNFSKMLEPDSITPDTRYLIDTILTITRLRIERDSLRNFFRGELLPDVALGYAKQGFEVVQFDGIFLPSNIEIPKFANHTDKEKFLFSLGNQAYTHQDTVPSIVDNCIPLEIKTVYRARTVAGMPPLKEILSFQLEEFIDRLGRSCVKADIAIAPRKVVFLYLNGIQPNAIFYKNLDSHFYRTWAEHAFQLCTNGTLVDFDDRLEAGILLDFTTMMAEKLEEEERQKRDRNSPDRVFAIQSEKLSVFEDTENEVKPKLEKTRPGIRKPHPKTTDSQTRMKI